MAHFVLGLGQSGKSASRLLLEKGKRVFAYDDRSRALYTESEIQDLLSRGLEIVDSLKDFERYDEMVVSPGISPRHSIYNAFIQAKIPIISEVELALRYLSIPCLAITGTKGKTTSALFLSHFLRSLGYKAEVFGNHRAALSSYFFYEQHLDVIVLELSSFQLERMYSKKIDGGIILNISPDHMDRYETMQDYIFSKSRIQHCLKKNAKLFLFEDLYKKHRELFQKDFVVTFNKEKKFDSFLRWDARTLAGLYHLARGFCSFKDEEFFAALHSFSPLAHRMEFIAEIKGISFYNDSKATNVESVIFAVNALPTPIVLIAGGEEKMLDYRDWKEAFSGKVTTLFLIGKCAEKIYDLMRGAYRCYMVSSLKDAVLGAYEMARSEAKTVLLSPGSSSFDMFRNYEHRGDTFRCIVQWLEKEKS